MIGEVLDGRPHHLCLVRDGLESGAADQRGRGGIPVVDVDLELLVRGIVGCGDLAEAILAPREEGRADAAVAKRRLDEADLCIDERTVGLLIPPNPAIAHRLSGDLGDEQVALGVAALQVVVPRSDPLLGLDAIRSLALGEGSDDAGEVRVVGTALEGPEDDIGELGKRWHGLNLYHPIHRDACNHGVSV